MALTQNDTDFSQPSRIANIVALSIGTSAIVFDGGISAVTLPTIAKVLGISDAASVLIITGYQLVLVSTILPFAALSDRVGFQKVYRMGQCLFLAATLLLFFVQSLRGLIIVRLLQALGGAAALSVTAAFIRTLYPPNQLGRGLAINSVLISIAAAIAPTTGGFILVNFPWQVSFAAAAPFIVVSLLLGKSTRPTLGLNKAFDVKAAVLCTISIGSIFGGIELGVHGNAVAPATLWVLAGLMSGVALFRHEKGNSRPVFPIDLLTNPFFSRAFAAAVATFMASMVFTIYLPFWMTRVQDRSVTDVGLLLAISPLAMMLVAPLSGLLSDKILPGRLGAFGMAAFVSAVLLVASAPNAASWTQLGWRLTLGGVGLAMFLATNSRLIVSVAPPSRAASAGSMVSTARLFGQALGATMVASILSRVEPRSTWPFVAAASLGTVSFALCVIQSHKAAGSERAKPGAL
jgi:MFS transporter, DHA2 family, multidrug resistance protein